MNIIKQKGFSEMAASIKDRIKEVGKLNKLLANNLVDAIWVVDAKTQKYEYISPSVFRMSGFSFDEIVDTPFTSRLRPQSIKKARQLLDKALTNYEQGKRNSESLEIEFTHKNGDKCWAEFRAKVFKEGEDYKIVGITKEITPRKKAEQNREDLNRRLTEALMAKEKLIQETKLLKSLLPICSACKRIRDDNGKWWPLEAYVRAHTNSDFSHTLCIDCKDVLYPEI